MKNKTPASVYIISRDAENYIERALKSVMMFDEIIVVDSGSTDRTKEIATKYTSNFIFHKFDNFSAQKEFAKSLCKNQWVLNIDADEELSESLHKVIITTIKENIFDALDIPIRNYFLHHLENNFKVLNRRIRFFKKDKGSYGKNIVHESIKVDGKIKKVKNYLLHYGEESLDIKLEKIQNYANLRVIEKIKQNKKSSLLKLIFIFPLAFFKGFFLKRCVLDGRLGFVKSMMDAFYAFLKEAKLYEKQIKNKVIDEKNSKIY